MERPSPDPAARGAPNDDGNSGAVAPAALGGEIGDLVEGAGNEVDELHFRDGPHPHQRCADGGPDDPRLGNRSVNHPLLAEPLQEPLRYLEGAAVDANVL